MARNGNKIFRERKPQRTRVPSFQFRSIKQLTTTIITENACTMLSIPCALSSVICISATLLCDLVRHVLPMAAEKRKQHSFDEPSQMLDVVLFTACGDISPLCRSHGNKTRGVASTFLCLAHFCIFLYTVISQKCIVSSYQEKNTDTLSLCCCKFW